MDPTLEDDLFNLEMFWNLAGDEYADEDHDDPELKEAILSAKRLTRALRTIEHVAWLRWNGHTYETCDSDSTGAFKAYRHPLGKRER